MIAQCDDLPGLRARLGRRWGDLLRERRKLELVEELVERPFVVARARGAMGTKHRALPFEALEQAGKEAVPEASVPRRDAPAIERLRATFQ